MTILAELRLKHISACIFLVWAVTSLVAGCGRTKHNPDLDKAAELADVSPRDAMAVLDSVDYSSLSTPDRHLHDLLTIKAKDKEYILHTSDSLILDVIKYYSHSDDAGLYAEALYYGGRVYSDMGDYPSAMTYFQMALDSIPDASEYIRLRGSAGSQYGNLLANFRMYEDAIPYMKESLEIDRILKDSINEVYDLHSLGNIYSYMGNYKEAQNCFHDALVISKRIGSTYFAKSSMLLAALKYEIGETDSAVIYVRGTPDNVKPVSRNAALAYSSRIYNRAGMPDSAYFFAKQLIESSDNSNKQAGFHIMLLPAVRQYAHPDSIDSYLAQYRTLLENLYDENENRIVLEQQAAYNYSLHERERRKAEKRNQSLIFWLGLFIIIGLLLFIVVLLQKNRIARSKIRLRTALDSVEKLRLSLSQMEAGIRANPESSEGAAHTCAEENLLAVPDNNVRELSAQLRKNLMELYSRSLGKEQDTPAVILQSEAYRKLQEFIVTGKAINPDDYLWRELEDAVLSASPRFKENLTLLMLGNLKRNDLHTALLVKCGVQPGQMATLLSRSKGAIASRRESLCVKMLEGQYGTKVIDAIIRLL